MLRTRLCELLGIEYPVIQAAIGPWSSAELVAAAESEDAVKVEFANHVFPAPSKEGGYGTLPRVLRTAFVEEWNQRQGEAEQEAERLGNDLITAIRQGRGHELVPFSGQTAGMIHEIVPAGEIVRRMVAEAEEALRGATTLLP